MDPDKELISSTGITVVFPGIVVTLNTNNKGDVLFAAGLSGGSGGIFLYSNGNINLIVKSVIAQPLNEKAFISIGPPDLNDNGEIVFVGNLSGKVGI